MKVLHVVRQFLPSVGGFEDVVVNLCRELKAGHGIESRVVTLNRIFAEPARRLPEQETIAGIPVRRISYAGSSRYPLAPGVFRELGDADLVHVHCIDFFFDAFAATKWLHRRPLIASTHGGFFHTRFAALAKRIYFNTVTRASCLAYSTICASSDSDLRLFRRIAPDNTALVENGVDILKWRDAASRTVRPTMIFIGRFATNKRIDLLFPILHELRKIDPSWRLIVAGREYDLRLPELEVLAEMASVRDAVKFVTAPTDQECRALIGASTYFASASAHEGFGLSVVEGLSAGLVPILSDIPPFQDFIRHGGVGRIVDVNDPQQAALGIQALHQAHLEQADDWRAASLGAAGRYTWPDVAARFAAIYSKALGEARPPRSPRSVAAPVGSATE
jgi:alpha-1,3-mannosyltransferase